MICSRYGIVCALGILAFMTGCSNEQNKKMDLIPTSYDSLPGWDNDRHGEALPALKHTCKAIEKKPDSAKMLARPNGDGQVADWKPVCRKLKDSLLTTHEEVRNFVETHFSPYQISHNGDTLGTFTGYYIPILRGSRKRHGAFQTPLYRVPKGNARKVPRSRIVAGALKNKGLEILYVDDPIDAFFVQIQGTGRIIMEDGSEVRLNVAGQNGFPYFPIGKALLDRGYLAKGQVSMQNIRKWLQVNPRQAEEIMSLNQSYVFFKEDPWSGHVVGSHNVPLTPHRSLAVDRSYIPLGTPVWLAANHPFPERPPLQQLMVAQDTGGAIKGAIRGDYYWGVGDHAAEHAGVMNSKGQMYLFLPK
jgi:membrane-bound lytic murein transglycosylase A